MCFKCGDPRVMPISCVVRMPPPPSAAPNSLEEAIETRDIPVVLPLCSSCDARWKSAVRMRSLPLLVWALGAVACIATVVVLARLGAWDGAMKLVAVVPFAVVFCLAKYVAPRWVERRFVEPATCGAAGVEPGWIALTRVHPHVISSRGAWSPR